jgi:hypothetical protein
LKGCMVVTNQLGNSVVMGPADSMPQLQSVSPAFLSLSSASAAGGAVLALTGKRLAGQRALVRHGRA